MKPSSKPSFALALASLVLASVATGCGKNEPSATASTASSAAASAGSIGVPECDAYLTKYEACIAKMSGPAKMVAEPALKIQRDSFKQSAATPAGKASLANTCKQSMESIKPSCP